MEVLGAIASTLALVQVGLKLKQLILDIPTHRRRLVEVITNICQDLECLHDLAQNHQWKNVIALPDFCDAITSLDADLQIALTKCQKMNHARWSPITNWRNGYDTELELIKIEKKIVHCHQRFSTLSSARGELSFANLTYMTDQFRQEVLHRLDFIEDHLKTRVARAEVDPADAAALIGVPSLSGPAIQKAVDHAHEELAHCPLSTVEYHYLRLKVDTLIRSLLAEKTPFQGQPPSSASVKTHYATSDDPTEQRGDVVLETMRIIRMLRTRDASTPSTEFAYNLEDLAMELLDLGLYKDARQIYEQVLQIYQRFVANGAKLAVVDAMVARALVGVSTCFQRLGQSGEGLHSIQRAVDIFVALEEAHPGDFKHGLALALNNLANHLRDFGDYMSAKDVIDKALIIRRDLAKELPEVYKPDLAASLLNASTCYSKFHGLEHEALNMVDESVRLSRELVNANSALFEAHLAAALHNMANRRAGLQDNLLAYENICEAVVIRRNLAARRHLVFGTGFTRSLRVAKRLARRCGDTEAEESFHKEWISLCKPGEEGTTLTNPTRVRSPVMYNKTVGPPNPPTPEVFYTPDTAVCQVISPAYQRRVIASIAGPFTWGIPSYFYLIAVGYILTVTTLTGT